MKKIRYGGFISILAVSCLLYGTTVWAHTEEKNEDLMLLCDYIESHDLDDYLSGISEEAELSVNGFSVADLDFDGCQELIIKGDGAGANTQISIIDLGDEEAECVYSEWGTVLGKIYDEELGCDCVVMAYGNGDMASFDGGIYLITPEWEKVPYCSSYIKEEEKTYYDGEQNEISESEYNNLYSEILNHGEKIEYTYDYSEMNMQVEDIRKLIEETPETEEKE